MKEVLKNKLFSLWRKVSSDKEISMIEVNSLTCLINSKFCISWLRLYLPLPGSNGALDAMQDVSYLKRVLRGSKGTDG